MKKRWLAGILSVVMAAAMTGCGGSSSSSGGGGGSDAKPVNLKMAYTTSETSVWRVACEEFARLVEEGTEGRYTVSIYANEQLASGDMTKGTEMILDGSVDVDLRSIGNFPNYEPKTNVFMMPWMFTDNDDVDAKLFSGDGLQATRDLIEPLGLKVLGLGENGFRQVTNNKHAIRTVDDMKFLKMRVPPITMWMDTFKMLGADPTVMSFSEVFTALQQGTIDGQENPTDPIMSSKLYEVQKYMTRWNYAYDFLVLSVSNKLWDSLSDEDKAIFQEAATAACAEQVKQSREADAENFKLFEENGMEIIDLTPEETDAFKEAVQPLYDQYREQVTDEVFEAFGYTFED